MNSILLFILTVILLCCIKIQINKKQHIISLGKYPEIQKILYSKNIILKELNNIIKLTGWSHYKYIHHISTNEKTVGFMEKKLKEHETYIGNTNSWLVYGLLFNKSITKNGKKYCPKTTELLSRIPYVTDAGFSCMEAKSHIPIHTDDGINYEGKKIYRYHLPLLIPDECEIMINGEMFNFDKPFIFDDTFEHQVWNKSEHPRIILIVDFLQ